MTDTTAAQRDDDQELDATVEIEEATDSGDEPEAPSKLAKTPKASKAIEAAEEPKANRAATAVGAPRAWILVAALILVLAVAGGAWSYVGKRDAVRARDAAVAQHQRAVDDLGAARKAAEEYSRKALTIDFNRAPDYVKSLAEGTTKTFGDSFSMDDKGAGKLIVELQQQLRMVASGDVAYTLFDGDIANPPQSGQPWNMIVIANQTSTTAQQPDRATQVMILKVVVVQLEGQWKIANFGPDPKSMGASTAIPGAK